MAHRHTKPDAAGSQKAGAEETPVNCEHHGGSGLSDCPMDCCRESSPTLAPSAVFVIPEPAKIDQPCEATIAAETFAATEFVQSFAPPTPPPRLSLFFQ